MKKILAMVMILALCVFAFCACGQKDANPTRVENPVKSVDEDKQVSETGFALSLPEEDMELVDRSIVEVSEDEKIAEITFKYNEVEYCYRVQSTGEMSAYDMSGLYYKWENTLDVQVAGRDGFVSTCSEASLIAWLDVAPGVNYNLSCLEAVDADTMMEVAEMIFDPVQEGEAE